MATMKQLIDSNAQCGVTVMLEMIQYKMARETCFYECERRVIQEGATIDSLKGFIEQSQKDAKQKVIDAIAATIPILENNIKEAKEFERPDENFIRNTELALEKARTLIITI